MSAELPKIPEPVAWLYTAKNYPDVQILDRTRWSAETAANYIEQPLIPASFAQEAARQAIERCAEVCDDQEEPAWYGYENPNTFDDGKRACASAIRALTHESEKRHGH